ncbi:LOW QUALITY PROTEIN: hypothetical protein RJ641_000520, partial [Dillenia turbinata]
IASIQTKTSKDEVWAYDINFAERPYLLTSRIMSYDSTNIAFPPNGTYGRHEDLCIRVAECKVGEIILILERRRGLEFIESIRLKIGHLSIQITEIRSKLEKLQHGTREHH